MTKVLCNSGYCKWCRQGICNKPKITLDRPDCSGFETVGLDKASIDKVVNMVTGGGE